MADLPKIDFADVPKPVQTYHRSIYARIDPKSNFDGKGKTVLITGGATGVGYSITKSFAEAGVARAIIISRSPGPQEEAKKELEPLFPSTKFIFYQASVTDHARMREIMEETASIDVIALNAAAGQLAPAAGMTMEEFQSTFDTNVFSIFNMTQTYLRLPTPTGGKKTVLNVSSNSAHVRFPGMAAYGPSKAATAQLMSLFALEQDASKVKFVSFHPGAFFTSLAESAGIPKDAYPWEDITLPGHFSVWLASAQSDFLNGKYVWAHWDVDEMIALKERFEKDGGFCSIGLVQ